MESVNYYLSLFLQSGLITKWYSDTTYIYELEAGLQNRHFIHSNKIQLSLGHLQIAFFILFFGILLSFVAFGMEMWSFYLEKKNGNSFK